MTNGLSNEILILLTWIIMFEKEEEYEFYHQKDPERFQVSIWKEIHLLKRVNFMFSGRSKS